jgi:hypothetical protein
MSRFSNHVAPPGSRFSGLAAALGNDPPKRALAAAAPPSAVAAMPPKPITKKEAPMASKPKDESFQAGHAAGFKEASDRMAIVFASEHYAGREAYAHKMLGKAGLSGSDIVDLLAASPKAGLAARRVDPKRADGVWDRARAAKEQLPRAVPANAADGPWDRARAANGKGAQA